MMKLQSRTYLLQRIKFEDSQKNINDEQNDRSRTVSCSFLESKPSNEN